MALRDRWAKTLTPAQILRLQADGLSLVADALDAMAAGDRMTPARAIQLRNVLDGSRDDLRDLAQELDTAQRTARSGERERT